MSPGPVREPCIVAMGGGGFSMEPDNPLLDDYVLGLAAGPEPRVCFVPTASGDADDYVARFYEAFGDGRARPSHLALFTRTVEDVRAFLLSQDVIYVGGGNTANMLAVWRLHGVDAALRAAWQAGVVLCGLSAGSLCYFREGVTDSFGPRLRVLKDGLGFLPASHCPHYDGEPERRPAYRRLVASGELSAGLAADDGVGLRYRGAALLEVVSSRPGARAWRVEPTDDGVRETVIVPRYLGEDPP
jgi:dipeptidase E